MEQQKIVVLIVFIINHIKLVINILINYSDIGIQAKDEIVNFTNPI